jgi:hypothetical protein
MKKYVVTVYEIHGVDIEVEAENRDHAKEIANEKIDQYPYTVEYYSTKDVDDWQVLEIGEVE